MRLNQHSSMEEQKEYLTKNPHMIRKEWIDEEGMFSFIPNTLTCLTMVRDELSYLKSKRILPVDLLDQIANDKDIPHEAFDIIPEQFDKFIYYQREIQNIFKTKDEEPIISH